MRALHPKRIRDRVHMNLFHSVLADELTSFFVIIFSFMMSAGVASLKSEGECWIP